jgi:hypothetical protein
MRPVEVPPAGKADTLRFLQMQVERQQALLRGGQIIWSHRLHAPETDSPLRKAFLVLCKVVVVRPVEAALRACKLQPVFATVSSLIAGVWAGQCSDFPVLDNYLLVLVEAGGSTIVEYTAAKWPAVSGSPLRAKKPTASVLRPWRSTWPNARPTTPWRRF